MSQGKHPRALPILFLTEMWERFSFYCMLSILSLYMNAPEAEGGLGFGEGLTGQIYGAYLALVYFAPIGGGWLADRFLGLRNAITLGAVLMGLGHAALAFPSLPFFFLGLSLLILGNGLFKPNISALLGALYGDEQELKDRGYSIFYMGINVGALISPFAAAYFHRVYGWHAAFGAAGVGMLFSIVIFLSFRSWMVAKTTAAERGSGAITPVAPAEERQRVLALLTVFGIVIFFWLALHQDGLTLAFWARDNSDGGAICNFFGFQCPVPAEISESINPAFILLLTPVLVGIWGLLARRGKEPSTPAKMVLGMIATAACYVVMATAGKLGGDTGQVSYFWLVGGYGLMTTGELCLSPMGLSLVSKLAPPRMRGRLMGGWFAATAVGSYLVGVTGYFWPRVLHSTFFLGLVATSLLAAIVLRMFQKWLDGVISRALAESAKAAV
jgi:POT family proton-dependent oligopeptide transporter